MSHSNPNVKTVTNVEDKSLPTPTNSLIRNFTGANVPANPKDFASREEADALVALMIAEGCIPSQPGSEPTITDEPESVGQVIYGDDGRRVFVIRWTEPSKNPQQPDLTYAFSPNAGQLQFEFQNFPLNHGDWKKSYSALEVNRVGLQTPQKDANGMPGQTFTSGL